MEHLMLKLGEAKALSEDDAKAKGEDPHFEGEASTTDTVDAYNEIVDEGAFTRTLKHKKGQVPLLADHNPATRLGVAKLQDQGKSLHLRGFMNMEKQLARDVLSDVRFSIKHKMALGLSIGFETVKDEFVKGVRHLQEIKLWEVSVVTFPANHAATVTSVKGVVAFQDLSLAGRDLKWDANAAQKRVREWAGAEDGPNAKYRRAFTWFDSENSDNFGAYKLQIADVIDGKLTVVPRGVFAAAGAVQGARGGVDIPDKDMPGVRSHLGRYYKKMDLTAPWDKSAGNFPLDLASMMDYATRVKENGGITVGTAALIRGTIESLKALLPDGTDPTDPASSHFADYDYLGIGLTPEERFAKEAAELSSTIRKMRENLGGS